MNHLSDLRNRHHKEVSDFVIQRFLGGVADELTKRPEVEGFWVDFSAQSSTDWIRPAASESQARSVLGTLPPAVRAFYKSLGSHRGAISSNDTEVRQIMRRQLPCWHAPERFVSREAFLAAAAYACTHPGSPLTPEALAQAQADQMTTAVMGQSLTPPSTRRPHRL